MRFGVWLKPELASLKRKLAVKLSNFGIFAKTHFLPSLRGVEIVF